MYGLPNLDSLLDRAVVRLLVDIGFSGKLLGGGRVAFCYEVFHDQVVDVPRQAVSGWLAEVFLIPSRDRARSDSKIIVFSSRLFREIPILSKVHPSIAQGQYWVNVRLGEICAFDKAVK